MLFKINHNISYTYNKPIFLERHSIKLKPKSDNTQQLHEHNIKFEPHPSSISYCLDLEGNNTIEIWFENLTDKFSINSFSTVETLRKDPFDFIIDNSATTLPINYSDKIKSYLYPYLKRRSTSKKINEFATKLQKTYGRETLTFLGELNSYLYKNFENVRREFGDPLDPNITLEKKSGSCRDLAMLFIEICSSLGIASRFVSGYNEIDVNINDRDLHAWAEVYIPGGGWRGFDPSLGLAVADKHIAVASGINSLFATPVDGSFRGNNIKANMKHEIKINY